MARPFRFAVSAHEASDGAAWRRLVADAEALGYATVVVPDHFNPQLAPLPAIAVAAATSNLRVGVLVACNDFRHPAMHAKELATIDLLSDGRLDWGMGAGWLPTDYAATGIPFDPPGQRVSRLAESIAVMKALFSGDPVDHDGDAYRFEGLVGTPTPVQRPHPPLLIGAGGPRMLALAGREADIVGVAPSILARSFGDQPPRLGVGEATDLQLQWVRDAAGERFDQLEINMAAFPTVVVDSPADRTAKAEELALRLGSTPEQFLATPHVWVGTIDQICANLVEHRERWGVSYWSVPAVAMHRLAPIVERLAGT